MNAAAGGQAVQHSRRHSELAGGDGRGTGEKGPDFACGADPGKRCTGNIDEAAGNASSPGHLHSVCAVDGGDGGHVGPHKRSVQAQIEAGGEGPDIRSARAIIELKSASRRRDDSRLRSTEGFRVKAIGQAQSQCPIRAIQVDLWAGVERA